MSTRSLTVVLDGEDEILAMYKHCDGWPKGFGAELLKILKGCEIVNGYRGDEPRAANGMGCLAAQIVGHFQGGELAPDEIMLRKPGVRDVHVQYIYRISQGGRKVDGTRGNKLWLVVADGYNEEQVYYSGWMDKFDPVKTQKEIHKQTEFHG